MKWIEAGAPRYSESRKTYIWMIAAVDGGPFLGEVRWYAAFFPAAGTIFESACLHDLADFCANAKKPTLASPPK